MCQVFGPCCVQCILKLKHIMIESLIHQLLSQYCRKQTYSSCDFFNRLTLGKFCILLLQSFYDNQLAFTTNHTNWYETSNYLWINLHRHRHPCPSGPVLICSMLIYCVCIYMYKDRPWFIHFIRCFTTSVCFNKLTYSITYIHVCR